MKVRGGNRRKRARKRNGVCLRIFRKKRRPSFQARSDNFCLRGVRFGEIRPPRFRTSPRRLEHRCSRPAAKESQNLQTFRLRKVNMRSQRHDHRKGGRTSRESCGRKRKSASRVSSELGAKEKAETTQTENSFAPWRYQVATIRREIDRDRERER